MLTPQPETINAEHLHLHTLRVLVVDDSGVVRRAIRRLLQSEPDMEVVSEASDGAEAVRQALQLKPEVVLLDAAMPVMNGFEACRRIKSALPSTTILMVSQFHTAQLSREAVAAGASASLLKSDAPRELLPALRKIQASNPC